MKGKKENGEVVVEASIVVTIALIFITVMLFVGIVFYHQTMLTSVANKTAASIAQVYSNSLKDPFTGYVDIDSVYQAVTYENYKTDNYLADLEKKANALAKYRMKSSSMLPAELEEVDVQVVKKPNELLKSQVVVTIKGRYNVPLAGFFKVNDDSIEFEATGRADCTDFLEYANGVEAIGNPEEAPVQVLPDADTCVVTFVTNKYNGTFYAAVPVLKGKSIVSSNRYSHSTFPGTPSFNKLEFTNWVTSGGQPFSATTQVNSDMTVYASWLCLVKFDPTSGSVSPTQKKVEYNKATTLPTPTISGYAFEGWYTEKEGGGTRYQSNVTAITSNITLYAKWRCTHDFTATQIYAGTCQKRSKFRYTCVRCPYSYEAEGNFGSCKHDGGAITVQPTCVSVGTKIYKCIYCNATKVTETVPMIAHNKNIVDGPHAATCTARGYTNYNCSMCRRTIETKYTNALGHSMQYYEKAPTCTENGYSCERCSRCGYEANKTYTDALGHDFDARCGKTHTFYSGQAYAMEKQDRSAGYYETTAGECILCIRCHAPRGGWTTRGGETVSVGMICRKHNEKKKNKYGKYIYTYNVEDNAWKSMKDLKMH